MTRHYSREEKEQYRRNSIRIKTRMIELGYTARDVAEYLDAYCDYQRVARIIRGESRTTSKERTLIARALKCAQKDLFRERNRERNREEDSE